MQDVLGLCLAIKVEKDLSNLKLLKQMEAVTLREKGMLNKYVKELFIKLRHTRKEMPARLVY